MKMVWVIYNQVIQADVMDLMEEMEIRGFTRWREVQGRGGEKGDPHMGTFTWPSLNGVMMCVMEEEKARLFIEALKGLDEELGTRGLRAYMTDVEAAF